MGNLEQFMLVFSITCMDLVTYWLVKSGLNVRRDHTPDSQTVGPTCFKLSFYWNGTKILRG